MSFWDKIKKAADDVVDTVAKTVQHDAAQVATVATDVNHDFDKVAVQTGKQISKIVQKIANDAADVGLAELIPFKDKMKAAIMTAKYPDKNPPNDTLHLAQEFIKKVIQQENLESLDGTAKGKHHKRKEWNPGQFESFWEERESYLEYSEASDVAQGAAIGAAAGTIVPGVGTAIGTGIGTLVALIINWFKQAYTAVTSSPGGGTPQQQAAIGTVPLNDSPLDTMAAWFDSPTGQISYEKVGGAIFGILAIFGLLYVLSETETVKKAMA